MNPREIVKNVAALGTVIFGFLTLACIFEGEPANVMIVCAALCFFTMMGSSEE